MVDQGMRILSKRNFFSFSLSWMKKGKEGEKNEILRFFFFPWLPSSLLPIYTLLYFTIISKEKKKNSMSKTGFSRKWLQVKNSFNPSLWDTLGSYEVREERKMGKLSKRTEKVSRRKNWSRQSEKTRPSNFSSSSFQLVFFQRGFPTLDSLSNIGVFTPSLSYSFLFLLFFSSFFFVIPKIVGKRRVFLLKHCNIQSPYLRQEKKRTFSKFKTRFHFIHFTAFFRESIK